MPYRNKTGPNGAGPGTGIGMGPCVGDEFPRFWRRGGMGLGHRAGNRGFVGRGSGRTGYGYNNAAFQIDEKEYLSSEVESLEKNLEFLKNRLKEIEPDTKK